MKYLLSRIRLQIKRLTKNKKEFRYSLVGPSKLWNMKRDFQFQFLSKMGLERQHHLFEIGCGTLRGGIPLIQYLDKDHYFGVEIREIALNEGKKELKEFDLEGKNPTLLLSPDISEISINCEFDYIWSFSVLFHMEDKVLNKTISFVSKHLSKDGIFYANVNIGNKKEGSWQGFPVVTRSFDFYQKICDKYGLSVSDIGSLEEVGHISNIDSQDNQRMLKIVRKL